MGLTVLHVKGIAVGNLSFIKPTTLSIGFSFMRLVCLGSLVTNDSPLVRAEGVHSSVTLLDPLKAGGVTGRDRVEITNIIWGHPCS